MRRRSIAVLVVAVGLLLTAGVVSAETVIDDFEDGDLDGWSTSSGFSTTQSTVIEGDWAMDATQNSNDLTTKDFTADTYSNVSFFINYAGFDQDESVFFDAGDDFSGPTVGLVSSEGWVHYQDQNDNRVNTSIQISTDVWYEFRLTNLDYANHEFDIEIYYGTNGSLVGTHTNAAMRSDADDLADVNVNTKSGGGMYIDYIAAESPQGIDQAASGENISGQVIDQEGDPVPNATVNILQVNKTTLENLYPDPDKLERRSRQLRENASDALPENFENPDLLNNQPDSVSDFLQDLEDERYVLVHRPEDWGVNDINVPIAIQPDLPQATIPGLLPSLPDPVFEVEESRATLALSVWRPWQGLSDGIQNRLDNSFNGRVVKNASVGVTIREISWNNETLDTFTTNPEIAVRRPIGEDFPVSFVTLDTGLYWITPETGGVGYYLKVGEPSVEYGEDMFDEAGNLLERAQWIRNKIQDNNFSLSKVATNSTGHWNFSVPSNVHSVTVQAHKGPVDDLKDHFSKWSSLIEVQRNANMSDYRSFMNATSFNGSFYIPMDYRLAEPGDSGILLPTQEVVAPHRAEQPDFEDAWEWLQDFLADHSYEEALQVLKERISQLEDEEAREAYAEVYNLIRRNRQLEDRANDLLEDNENLTKTLQEYQDQLNSTNVTKLKEAIAEMEEALNEQQSGVGSSDGTAGIANESLTASRVFDTDVSDDGALAIIEFANGSSTRLTPDSQYMSIEDGVLLDGDEVRIEDYPVGDSPVVGIQWVVVSSEGVARATDRARNPTFGGDVPGLDAIDVSTLAPGPSDRVDVELHPGDGAAFGSLQDLTVYGPGGNALATTLENNRAGRFTTNGSGLHRVEATYSDASGQNFTTTFRLLAEAENRPMEPGVRVVESVVGTYALTGDGLDGGSVDLTGGGSTASIEARIASDGEVPGTLHVYAHGLSLAPATTRIAVVRGDEGRTVSQNVRVVYHGPAIGSDGLVWREAGGESFALPAGEATQHGVVERTPTNTTVRTVTNADGRVAIRTVRDPGLVTRAQHWAELRWQSVSRSLPSLGIAFLFGAPRRRREREAGREVSG